MHGCGSDRALFPMEGLEGKADDFFEALVLEPAIEAFLLPGGELAFVPGIGLAAPGGDLANDLGDAGLVEVVVFGQFRLGFAGGLPGEEDFLVAGGGGGAFAGFARGEHGRFSGETGSKFKVQSWEQEQEQEMKHMYIYERK